MKSVKEKVKKIFLNFDSFGEKTSSSRGIAFIPLIIILAAGGGIAAIAVKLGLAKAAEDLASGIIAAIAAVLGGIGMTLMKLCKDLLNWVISDGFIGVSMTGMDNPLIAYGWVPIRDMANIFLILGLIIIALGIILGFEEYRAKKTLPALIIIALLINFTPVICGFIIDFSNTLMKWILGVGGVHPSFVDTVTAGYGALPQGGALDTLLLSLSYVIFGFVGAIVYLLYAILFAGRYIFLWILVVFSPIAFASKVFGENRYLKMLFPGFLHWDNWWGQFMQWNLIGIFGAFFIFLANKLMEAMALGQSITSAPTGDLAAFGALFIYLLPVLLLLIGLFATIESASAGMAVVPGMGKALGTMAAGAMIAGKWTGKKAGEMIPEKTKEWGLRQARALPPGGTSNYGKGEAGVKGWTKRRLGQIATTATSPLWMTQRAVGKVISGASMGQMDDINVAKKKAAGQSAEKQAEMFMTAGTRGSEVGSLEQIIEDNNIDDVRLEMKTEKEKKQFDEKVKRVMGEAAMVSRGSFNRIARAFPQFVDEAVRKLNPEIRKKMRLGEEDDLKKEGLVDRDGNASYAQQVIQGIKPDDVGKIDRDALALDIDDKDETPVQEAIQEAIHKFWGGYHDEALIKTHKRAAVDKYQGRVMKKGAVWYAANNPSAASWLSSIFAPESGLFAPEGTTLSETNDWIERFNEFKPEDMKKFQAAIDGERRGEGLPIETRKDLTQCLRIDPNRIEELKGEDTAGIEGKIDKWKKEWGKGKAAEVSAEEEIKQYEEIINQLKDEITEEEGKMAYGGTPESGKIKEKKDEITRLKEKLEKLKQRGADQSSDRDFKIEIPFVKPAPTTPTGTGATPPPIITPPPGQSTFEEKQPSPTPTWLKEGIEDAKNATPFFVPKKLKKFLSDEGVTEEEISKFESNPRDAWSKAEEILRRKETTSTPSAATAETERTPTPTTMTEEDTEQKIKDKSYKILEERTNKIKNEMLEKRGLHSGTPEAKAFLDSDEFRETDEYRNVFHYKKYDALYEKIEKETREQMEKEGTSTSTPSSVADEPSPMPRSKSSAPEEKGKSSKVSEETVSDSAQKQRQEQKKEDLKEHLQRLTSKSTDKNDEIRKTGERQDQLFREWKKLKEENSDTTEVEKDLNRARENMQQLLEEREKMDKEIKNIGREI